MSVVMIYLNKSEIELAKTDYVPITKGSTVYYGGSQMWFSNNHKLSNDYILHHYGCGTIATSDYSSIWVIKLVVYIRPP